MVLLYFLIIKDEKLVQRNTNIQEIVKNLNIGENSNFDITQFEHVFWLGIFYFLIKGI
jgi:hypothetical protein